MRRHTIVAAVIHVLYQQDLIRHAVYALRFNAGECITALRLTPGWDTRARVGEIPELDSRGRILVRFAVTCFVILR